MSTKLLLDVALNAMAGAGVFGIKFGMVEPIMTLVPEAIFGAVLGGVCAAPPGAAHVHQPAHSRGNRFAGALNLASRMQSDGQNCGNGIQHGNSRFQLCIKCSDAGNLKNGRAYGVLVLLAETRLRLVQTTGFRVACKSIALFLRHSVVCERPRQTKKEEEKRLAGKQLNYSPWSPIAPCVFAHMGNIVRISLFCRALDLDHIGIAHIPLGNGPDGITPFPKAKPYSRGPACAGLRAPAARSGTHVNAVGLGALRVWWSRELPIFPTTSLVSLPYVMKDGASAEIAISGNEGLVGIALFMGGETTPSRAVVQSAGNGYRLGANAAKREFATGGVLQHLALRYTPALITQMAQTAVCNRHHSLEQQLCRWLLLSIDRLLPYRVPGRPNTAT